MKKITIALLLLVSKTLLGQNLVSNGDFETMRMIPSWKNFGTTCAEGWFCPIRTLGDYYNRASESKLTRTPKNWFGYQEPHSGHGYAGICIQKGMVEYLETKLTSPLIKGQSYLVEFYVSRADKKPGYVSEFGISFSNQSEYFEEMNGLTQKPTIDFVNTEGYQDKKGWTKLSAIYVAEGYESVILLGHFNYLNPTKRIRKTHYYIDDVSITPIDDTTR